MNVPLGNKRFSSATLAAGFDAAGINSLSDLKLIVSAAGLSTSQLIVEKATTTDACFELFEKLQGNNLSILNFLISAEKEKPGKSALTDLREKFVKEIYGNH